MSDEQSGPWILRSDDDGHWYVIPADKSKAFDEYMARVYDCGVCDEPKWLHSVGGAPSLVHFETWWLA